MKENPQDAPAPALSAAALAEWTHHVESILRGLAHALNNRASALSAVIELSKDPDDDPAGTQAILASELDRMLDLAKVVRSLSAPGKRAAEAIAPGDVTPEVLAAIGLHSDHRDRAVAIDATSAPVIRAPRWMFVRALIAIAATLPATPPGERTSRLTLTEEEDWLAVRATPGAGDAVPSSYAAELARAMDGGPLTDGYGFRIPTLAAIRRREGR